MPKGGRIRWQSICRDMVRTGAIPGGSLGAIMSGVCDAAAGMVPRPVLVGHSMGGGVITSAAEVAPGAFEQLIYLAAFVPANGDSILKLASKEAAPPELIKRPWRGDSLFHQADAERIFFHDCPRSAHWASLVQPQPVQPVLARIRTSHGASNRIPRSYIAASHDRAIPLPFQRRMAAEAGIDRIAEIETGHSPFLAQPGQLADLLISLVKG